MLLLLLLLPPPLCRPCLTVLSHAAPSSLASSTLQKELGLCCRSTQKKYSVAGVVASWAHNVLTQVSPVFDRGQSLITNVI
jgi:hypothetical protein